MIEKGLLGGSCFSLLQSNNIVLFQLDDSSQMILIKETQMIRKNKFHKKGVSIFFSKRCAFLFSLFFVSFFNSQIYISEGITIKGSEFIYDKTTSNIEPGEEERDKVIFDTSTNSSKVLEVKKAINAQKAKPKTLITKKEKIEQSIQKKIDDQKRKKIEEVLLPKGKDSSDYFAKAKNSELSILLDNHNHLFSDYNSRYCFDIQVVISTSLITDLPLFIYKKSEDFFYSVRPPPFSV